MDRTSSTHPPVASARHICSLTARVPAWSVDVARDALASTSLVDVHLICDNYTTHKVSDDPTLAREGNDGRLLTCPSRRTVGATH